jgi:glycerol uptake facilitator protein
MTAFMGEVVGTALLITLGSGVVANVVLNKTLGRNSGWIVITFGWAIAVFVAVMFSANASGAHLNPAVTFAFAIAGRFPWEQVPYYLLAQFLGAFIGSFLVWLSYRKHFEHTEEPALKLAVFCTAPAIEGPVQNFLSEAIATFVFVMAVMSIVAPESKIGSLDALPVALVVLGIGLSMGGTTGYAINPARDLGPRIMHSILPIPGKSKGNWHYAWVPVAGPLVGAALAALVFQSL